MEDIKSVTIVEMKAKGDIDISYIPLSALRDVRIIKGAYDDLTLRDNYEDTDNDDYILAILSDEDDVPFALSRLRIIYPNIMRLEYDNLRTRNHNELFQTDIDNLKSEPELFAEFYKQQNGSDMSEEALKYVNKVFEELKSRS